MKILKHPLDVRASYCLLKKCLLLKLTLVLIFFFSSNAFSNGFSQTKVTLSLQSAPLEKVLALIEKNTRYHFLFSDNKLEQYKAPVSIHVKDEEVVNVLSMLLKNSGLGFYVLNNDLIVITAAGSHTKDVIKGTVQNENKQPLQGVTVVLKRSGKTALTDEQGNFTIAAEDGDTLVISYVGYGSQELRTDGKTPVAVTLLSASQQIAEVVVVGYGTQKKVNLTGAVNTVNTKLIANRPVVALSNALQGAVPGLTILSRPGDVGSDISSITVRGRGNLGSPEPLYVVDGIPVTSGDFARITPDDVENMSVLKDASAAAIYGSRAAYGVILVTTKRGKEGKTAVNYNAYYGLQNPVTLPRYLGSYDYATLYNEALGNAGKSPKFSQDALTAIQNHSQPDLYPDNNWYKLTLRRNAPIWTNELNITGGGKTRYYLSGAYMRQESLFPKKGLNRYSLRANTETDVSKIFKIGSNISFIRDEIVNKGGNVPMTWLARMVPLAVSKQSDGTWGSVNGGSTDATMGNSNPLWLIDQGGRSNNATNRVLAVVNATLTPFRGFKVEGNVSYNYAGTINSSFVNTRPQLINFFTKQPIPGTGNAVNSLTEYWENATTFLAQVYATYERTFNEHTIRLMGGSSYENYKDRTIQVVRKNFPTNGLDAIDAGSTDPVNTTASGGINQRAFRSFFGRFNYSFGTRYLFEANIRQDASSQFAPGHRSGTYPSVSGGWRISQESFMKHINWINELKLRASWGMLGNVNNVGYYDYFDGINTGNAAFLDQHWVTGAWPGRLPNPTLSWEKVNMTNIGLDASLFNRHIDFQVDVFNRLTKDILLNNANAIPQEAGINQLPTINAGKVRNKGVELSVTYNNHIGDLNFSVGGNFTRIWNKVVDLNGVNELPPSSYWINRVGQPIGSFYMYQAEGLFKDSADVKNHAFQTANTGPGDIKYKDVSGPNGKPDGKIDGNDRVIAGCDVPYKYYGINLFVSYKGFDLGILGQGVMDVQTYLTNESSTAFFNGSGIRAYEQQRWTKANPNPNALYPRLLISADNTQNSPDNVYSSYWLFNASYFRLKSLTLGYSLPASVTKALNVQRVRFYFSSNNLFTIRGDKRMKDFDPEEASGSSAYPQLKTTAFGLNVTF